MLNNTLINETGLVKEVNTTIINATNSIMNATNATIGGKPSAFLHNLLNPVALIVLLSVLFVAVALIWVLKKVNPVSIFLYANARIQARTNYMVSKKLLSELIEAKSLKEFKSLLRETTYGECIEKSRDDLKSFHVALEKGSISAIIELIELSPKKSKELFDAYLMFFESKILKLIYKAKFMGVKADEDLVYPIGNIDNSMLKHLLDAETISDIKVVMGPTKYNKIFEKEYLNLEEFEVETDKFVFKNFVDVIDKTKMYDGKYIIDILNKKIDILNIIALLKFRVRGTEKERQRVLLIDNNSELCSRFDNMINSGELGDFVGCFKGTTYFGAMKKAFESYEKDKSLLYFETELFRFFRKFVEDNDLGHTLGPYPLFSYLIKRELELRNLFVISKGIDANFSVEKIRGMVI